MASTVATQHLASTLRIQPYDHDPGATSATLCSPDGGTTIRYWDLRDYRHFGALISPKIMGGDITLFEIVASATVAFSAVTVVKATAVIALDADDDYAFLECTDDEVQYLGSTLRYVAARITNATGTDEAVVTYIGTPKNPGLDKTTAVNQA